MQRYIRQLLIDIKAAERYTYHKIVLPEKKMTFLEEMEELERPGVENPSVTLSEHCGLKKIQFPTITQLTEFQSQAIMRALDETYSTYGLCLDIPKGIPMDVEYKHYVNALDKLTFINRCGVSSIEFCGYNHQGICLYDVRKCPCFLNWEEEVLHTKTKPEKDWYDVDAMDVYWYDMLINYYKDFELFTASTTTNKASIEQLLEQLTKANRILYTTNASVSYKPKPSDIPKGVYKSFFECIGMDKPVFPKIETLTAVQLRLLTMNMHQLLGKSADYILFKDWEIEKQYDKLVIHWSSWAKVDTAVNRLRILFQPQEFTIFDNLPEIPYRSEYEEFKASLKPSNEQGNEPLSSSRDSSILEDDFPF